MENINENLTKIHTRLKTGDERMNRIEDKIDKVRDDVTVLKERDAEQNGKLKELDSEMKPVRAVKKAWGIPIVRKIIIFTFVAIIIFVLFAGGERFYNFMKDGLIKILGL